MQNSKYATFLVLKGENTIFVLLLYAKKLNKNETTSCKTRVEGKDVITRQMKGWEGDF